MIFSHSTNQIIVFWRCCCRCRRPCLSPLIKTTTATSAPQINDMIGGVKKNNRAARAARDFGAIFDVVCQTTT